MILHEDFERFNIIDNAINFVIDDLLTKRLYRFLYLLYVRIIHKTIFGPQVTLRFFNENYC
jgi:hypothetical protein